MAKRQRVGKAVTSKRVSAGLVEQGRVAELLSGCVAPDDGRVGRLCEDESSIGRGSVNLLGIGERRGGNDARPGSKVMGIMVALQHMMRMKFLKSI